jgi:FkbM family methyltransferase
VAVNRSVTVVDRFIEACRPYRFRGKMRLLNRLVPCDGEKNATVFGYNMTLDLSRTVQRDIYIGNYERAETKLVRSILRPGMTVLDVGANAGYYTALAAQIVGEHGRIFAIEPYPPNFHRLSAWIRSNDVTQTQAFNFALGATAGSAQMFSAFANTDAPVLIPHNQPQVSKVDVRTLDSCLSEWGLEHIDFMKLDVDGSEPAVLAGASEALATGKIAAVLCEFCEEWLVRAGSNIQTVWATLLKAGFNPVWPTSQMPTSTAFNQFFLR